MSNCTADPLPGRNSDGGKYWSHPQLRGAERAKLARKLGERYARGESTQELAASINRSFGFVRTLLSEAGVTMRRRGGNRWASRQQQDTTATIDGEVTE